MFVRLRNRPVSCLPTATIAAMEEISAALSMTVGRLSDENYAQSLDFFRFWFDIGQTYHQIPSDHIFDAIWNNRAMGAAMDFPRGKLTHSAAHLILRFASDAESDDILAPHSSGLQSRLCTRAVREFFTNNLIVVRGYGSQDYAGVNLMAHWANLGYVEEAAIRNHILQSLISHPTLHDHQAYALLILFKVAGATFEAYVDTSVVDRCFELLNKYCTYDSRVHGYHNPVRVELERVQQVRAFCVAKRGGRAKQNFQEVANLRERGWEGLPPPPVFTTGKPKPTPANQNDPTATPVATSLGLPNRDLEPQVPHPPPPEPVTAAETDIAPASPVTPATQSPSISIATLSDFTITDVSDEEPPIDPSISDTSDDEFPVDPTAIVQHKTFYLEDGNVEALCGNALFRVHTTVLSFHSPTLRRMFAQTNLAAAESPNGCPRILSSDTTTDFVTLLKIVYLPGLVTLPVYH